MAKRRSWALKRKDISFLNDVISSYFSCPSASFANQQDVFCTVTYHVIVFCKGSIKVYENGHYFRSQ